MSSGCLDDLQVLKASENKRDGALQSDLGFTLTGTVVPAALWSDGQTLWVADYSAGRVLAYLLSDGSRLPGQDFDQAVMSAAGNNRPSGLGSDGQTMWVADYQRLEGFRLSAVGQGQGISQGVRPRVGSERYTD